MSDRTIPAPSSALGSLLVRLTREQRVSRTRQQWPGKVRIAGPTLVADETRPVFSLSGFRTIGQLLLPAGAWVIHARAIFSIANHPGDALYTGREAVQVRLVAATPDGLIINEEIDLGYAQPSATPEPFYDPGFLDLPVPLFGWTTQEEPFQCLMVGQAWDTETVATPCRWSTKIMAQPV